MIDTFVWFLWGGIVILAVVIAWVIWSLYTDWRYQRSEGMRIQLDHDAWEQVQRQRYPMLFDEKVKERRKHV